MRPRYLLLLLAACTVAGCDNSSKSEEETKAAQAAQAQAKPTPSPTPKPGSWMWDPKRKNALDEPAKK